MTANHRLQSSNRCAPGSLVMSDVQDGWNMMTANHRLQSSNRCAPSSLVMSDVQELQMACPRQSSMESHTSDGMPETVIYGEPHFRWHARDSLLWRATPQMACPRQSSMESHTSGGMPETVFYGEPHFRWHARDSHLWRATPQMACPRQSSMESHTSDGMPETVFYGEPHLRCLRWSADLHCITKTVKHDPNYVAIKMQD